MTHPPPRRGRAGTTHCGRWRTAWRHGHPTRLVCRLPYGHTGWHSNGRPGGAWKP